ncbi:MAG: tetratricopeptide repeat protein [Prochlorococcus marinus CUG1438]|nr:tetratricopeptide repeat protein [Prochlorococcus marinus CUG1438]
MYFNNFLKKIICISLIGFYFFKVNQVQSVVPYYYLPTIKNLEKDSLSIGTNAYQLLYLGQIEQSLGLARLAVQINKKDEKLWLILSEAEVANKLYKNALLSLNKAQELNSKNSEIYFAISNIYLKITHLQKAKTALEKGLKLEPNNQNAIFQLGNILLMEKNYSEAIKVFDKAIKIKPDFWQAMNNKALAYFEKNNINLSIKFFEQAISIEENAEPLLGLASCLKTEDITKALELAKKALSKNHNYVNYDYRKEQLWGEKLQKATEILLENDQLQVDKMLAKSKINASS